MKATRRRGGQQKRRLFRHIIACQQPTIVQTENSNTLYHISVQLFAITWSLSAAQIETWQGGGEEFKLGWIIIKRRGFLHLRARATVHYFERRRGASKCLSWNSIEIIIFFSFESNAIMIDLLYPWCVKAWENRVFSLLLLYKLLSKSSAGKFFLRTAYNMYVYTGYVLANMTVKI